VLVEMTIPQYARDCADNIGTLPRGAPLPLQFVYNCTATVVIYHDISINISINPINPGFFFAAKQLAVF
jgi:hypothetical protein